jgi:ABC-2 type transport system ATP-binding protein
MDRAIVTSGLGKRYGAVTALDGLSLRVESGEVFGFLGPNGAGKTTTIRLLLGLLRPSAGTAEVLGTARWRCRDRDAIGSGYLPGELALWPGFSGWHTLRFLERLTERTAVDRDQLLDQLNLGDADLQRPVRTYSDGMKQKLGIVQALQCRPRLAFLDEPTKGLDPLVQQSFYTILTGARAHGTTVFLFVAYSERGRTRLRSRGHSPWRAARGRRHDGQRAGRATPARARHVHGPD